MVVKNAIYDTRIAGLGVSVSSKIEALLKMCCLQQQYSR